MLAGVLFLITISAWGMMELSQRSQPQRQGATRIGGVVSRLAGLAFLIAGTVVVIVTPHVAPGAAIRPGAVAFAAGLAAANWAGLAGLLLLNLTALLWPIHIEERALLATVGDRYRGYAAQHKRLVSLIW